MTIRDPEVLEVLRDEPELLALADAVTETQRLPRRARRRAVTRWALVAALAAAVLLAALLWPGGGDQNPVLDRALAAIGNGPVLHLVTRSPIGFQLLNLKTGRTVVPTEELESWSDQSGKRFHLIMRAKGRIVGELLYPQDAGTDGFTLGKVDPAYSALWSGYRDALAGGKATIERSGVLYGKPVYWLRFPSLETGRPGSLVAIDRDTYRPLAFRSEGAGGLHIDYRVLVAQTEPFDSSAFTRRSPHAPDPFGVSESSGMGSSSGPSGSLHLDKPWLTAGQAVAGLKLSSVNTLQEESEGKTSKGVELVYGSEGDLAKSVTIDELRGPAVAESTIPEGFARVSAGSSTQGGGVHQEWTVELVRDGVSVTIDTGMSRAVALQVARALRPV